jgi:urease accessory protein
MIRATKVIRAGRWSGVATDVVQLGFDDRRQSRLAVQGERGGHFLLDLAAAPALRDGDGLVLEDGRMVEVRARPEAPLAAKATGERLLQLAWHLGDLHVPAVLRTDGILIRPDPRLAERLADLGAKVEAVEAPFEPNVGLPGEGRDA